MHMAHMQLQRRIRTMHLLNYDSWYKLSTTSCRQPSPACTLAFPLFMIGILGHCTVRLYWAVDNLGA